MRTATITIDTAALAHNLNQVRSSIPKTTQILAMVKADAYGHGIENCITAFANADGLGVATFQEAQQIRQLGWKKHLILIEGVFSEDEWHQAIDADCQCLIHNDHQVEWALKSIPSEHLFSEHLSSKHSPSNQLPRMPDSRTIWLKLNTGMNRLGFDANSIEAIASKLSDAGYEIILTSHFANADVKDHPLNNDQIKLFDQVLTKLRSQLNKPIKASLCNSAGIINFPECHYDWVRPGIMLYGSSPISSSNATDLELIQAMRLEAKLMAIHPIDTGTPIGYGSCFKALKPMVKGIVSIGYGDGYPRVLDTAAWVSVIQDDIHYACKVIGRVAMDMIAIDLTHVPNPKYACDVVLWGNKVHEPSIDDIAVYANTISYELFCRLTQRPKRCVI